MVSREEGPSAAGWARALAMLAVVGVILAGCGVGGGDPRASAPSVGEAGELPSDLDSLIRVRPPIGSREWSFGGGPAQRVLNLRTELGLDASQIARIEGMARATEPEAATGDASQDRGAYSRGVHPGVADAHRSRYQRLTEDVRAILTQAQRERLDEIRQGQFPLSGVPAAPPR